MALIGQRIMGSTTRPRKRNFLQTCWIKHLLAWLRGCEVDFRVVYCFVVPYLMGVLGKGACCGVVGFDWLNCLRALATYHGMER